ncbi:MAG TPA: hypothetical protein PKA47_18560 [Accumulibacter sp.]|uniref:hypothetical protein n=1 Tax=Accumulibacter sp. TaxID=2053492 RepID=UPI002C59BD54|nr:hypothetical protein [Accumulibacter sp.]HMW57591.1 hypothetical protein [Accumulibacter sp.]
MLPAKHFGRFASSDNPQSIKRYQFIHLLLLSSAGAIEEPFLSELATAAGDDYTIPSENQQQKTV